MGFDLKSETGEEAQWTNVYWHLMLAVAEHYGWEPRGSAPPKGSEAADWSGSYLTNDGQLVTREDAEALKQALGRSKSAPDLESVSNAIHAARMQKAHEEAEELIAHLRITGEPRGLVARLNEVLRTMRGKPRVEVEQEPLKIAHIPLEEIESGLEELHQFCEKGPFRIW